MIAREDKVRITESLYKQREKDLARSFETIAEYLERKAKEVREYKSGLGGANTYTNLAAWAVNALTGITPNLHVDQLMLDAAQVQNLKDQLERLNKGQEA